MNSKKKLFLIVGFFLAIKPGSVWSRVFMNQDEALKLAFSSSSVVERKNVFLTPEQKRQIEQKAKSKLDSTLVTYYVGRSSSGIEGYSFFNSHIVRTMPETMMVVLNSQGKIRFVEVLSFFEPDDYLPPKKWLGLFHGKSLTDDLWVKRGIRNVTGATLTTQAITEATRRILATYEVILPPIVKGDK